MKNMIRRLTILALAAGLPASAAEVPPSWAYPVNPPGIQPAPEDGNPRQVPGSSRTFTLTQIRDLFNAPDWHPDGHPPMPGIVAHGSKPGVFACGYCHLPNGLGRPENSSLAGLPASYIVQQVLDFRSGVRRSSEPASLPINFMTAVAKSVNEDDLRIAAEYFAALKPKLWIRVIEAGAVPKTRVGGWMLIEAEGGGTEAIGNRIIEMPENLERTELRDADSSFIAYVPAGSVKKGEELASGGRGQDDRLCRLPR